MKHNMLRRTLTVLLALLMVCTGFTAFADETETTGGITILFDGEPLESDVAPFIQDGRTFVPMNVIFTKLGYEVEWDDETKTINAKKTAPDMEEIWIVLQIDLPMVVVNDVAIEMDVAPFVQDGRTFVPLRFVAEMDGCEVDWDPETRTVIVNTAAAKMTEEQEISEEQPEEEMTEEEAPEEATDEEMAEEETPEEDNTAEE